MGPERPSGPQGSGLRPPAGLDGPWLTPMARRTSSWPDPPHPAPACLKKAVQREAGPGRDDSDRTSGGSTDPAAGSSRRRLEPPRPAVRTTDAHRSELPFAIRLRNLGDIFLGEHRRPLSVVGATAASPACGCALEVVRSLKTWGTTPAPDLLESRTGVPTESRRGVLCATRTRLL